MPEPKPQPQGPIFKSATMMRPTTANLAVMDVRDSSEKLENPGLLSVSRMRSSFRSDDEYLLDDSKQLQRLGNPHRWCEPGLTRLGLYYPLSPCQARMAQSQLNNVLRKLEDVFRKHSLHANYTDSPISAICKSMDQVEFEVVLFAARDDSDQMILEMSRRNGDSIAFHLYAQHILCAVLDIAPPERHPEPVAFSSSSWNMHVLSQADSLGDYVEDVTEAIEIAANLVASDRYDACRLGLESTVHLTNPEKCGLSAAKAVARCLIHPEGPIAQNLSRRILEFACQETSTSVQSEGIEARVSQLYDDDFSHLALVILSQTLQIASGAQTMDVQTFLTVTCPEHFVDRILENVKNFESNPHRACYAVQCLASLCNCVPSTKARINRSDVEEAQLFGDSCHLALSRVTQRLLVNF